MDEIRREQLRQLALWLSRRRAVDEAVQQLTAYGPAATDRVYSHLAALEVLLEDEAQAFAALKGSAPEVDQRPLAGSARDEQMADVTSLVEARLRRSRG